MVGIGTYDPVLFVEPDWLCCPSVELHPAQATADGDVLTATWLRARCGNVAFDFESGQFAMEYLPESDQLYGMDVYWDRTGS